jgi:hypothetical protein
MNPAGLGGIRPAPKKIRAHRVIRFIRDKKSHTRSDTPLPTPRTFNPQLK